jgi:DNA-binding NarL/FixJ family response regulator
VIALEEADGAGGDVTPLPARSRVLIVDDHIMFAESLEMALSKVPDIEVVGMAQDGTEAVELVATERPDVVLLDYQLPGERGPEVATKILGRAPSTSILMLTASATVRAASASLQSGCIGFVTKDQSVDDVADAIRDAARGRAHLSASIVGHLLPRVRRGPGPNLELSDRELEILELIGHGLSGPAIASQLVLSHHTVRNHTSNVLRKLGVHSRLEAVARARKLRLIGEG